MVTRAGFYWYWHEYARDHGDRRRSRSPGPAAQVPARAPGARRRGPARRPAPAHRRPAPRGGRAAGQPVHHLLHVPRAGPPGPAVGAGPGRAGRRAADVRRRTPLPARPGQRPGPGPRESRRPREPPSRRRPARAPRPRRGQPGPAPRAVPHPGQGPPLGRAGRQPGRPRAVCRLENSPDGGAQPSALDVHHRPGPRDLPGVGARGAGHARPVPAGQRPLPGRPRRPRPDRRTPARQRARPGLVAPARRRRHRHRLQEAPPPPPRPRRVLPHRPPGRRSAGPDPGHLFPLGA